MKWTHARLFLRRVPLFLGLTWQWVAGGFASCFWPSFRDGFVVGCSSAWQFRWFLAVRTACSLPKLQWPGRIGYTAGESLSQSNKFGKFGCKEEHRIFVWLMHGVTHEQRAVTSLWTVERFRLCQWAHYNGFLSRNGAITCGQEHRFSRGGRKLVSIVAWRCPTRHAATLTN